MRLGPKLWTTVDGVQFCHWDRWLLRLAVEEPDGLAAIQERLTSRVRLAEKVDDTAEALLAQVRDLQARLALLSLTPTASLSDIERASTWLLRKATRRVWEGSVHRPTDVMRRTPRHNFDERARTGWWSNLRAFPVSPLRYYNVFVRALDLSSFDVSVDQRIVSAMIDVAERFLDEAASDDERLAIVRGYMTAAADAMEQLNTDGASITDYLELHLANYFAMLRTDLHVTERRRDLLEFAVWEGYGLLNTLVPFLRSLPDADSAVIRMIHDDLQAIAAELREALLKDFATSAERLAASIATPTSWSSTT